MENMIGALMSTIICAAAAAVGIVMAVVYSGRRCRELEAENAALSAELGSANGQSEALSAEIADVKAKNAALSAEIADAKAKNAALSAEMADAKAKNAALSAEMADAKAKNAALSAEMADVKAKNAALSAEMADAKAKNAALSAEMANAKAKNTAQSAELEEAKKKSSVPSVTQVAYDIAVDTWININNRLDSLGKSRRNIQPVYMLLAGRDVPDSALAAAMLRLDGERREEVHVIVGDIRQFMAVHRPVIDSWLKSAGEGGICSFCDAVRMPLGEEFDPMLDDDLLGDDEAPHATVAMVMRLGYLFPGSRNGCYRNKCKCIVAE